MKYTIIGGGIAGLTLALALKKTGIRAEVYEATPEIKPVGAGIVLAANAIKAFERMGEKEALIRYGRLLPAFTIYDKKGRIINRTDNRRLGDKYGDNTFTIHRSQLHNFLLSRLDPGIVHTHKQLMDIKPGLDSVQVTFQDGSCIDTEYLIIADGIHSVGRKKLLPQASERYAGYTCWRAVIDNRHLQLTETSETWGVNGRFGIVPLSGQQIYWFACVKAPQNDPAYRAYTVGDLLLQFQDYHNPIPDIIAATANNQLIWNDISDIAPIDRYAFGRVLLIGDAAHATTPNLGQGACQAIEDAIVLAGEIRRVGDAYEAFQTFEQKRLARTHWVIKTSRRMGQIAQLENPFLAKLRNVAMKYTPDVFQDRMWERLYGLEF